MMINPKDLVEKSPLDENEAVSMAINAVMKDLIDLKEKIKKLEEKNNELEEKILFLERLVK